MTEIVKVDTTETYVVTVAGVGPRGPAGSINDAIVSPDSTFSSAYIMELLNPWSLGGMSVSPSTGIFGQTISAVNLSWSSSYDPDTQAIDQGVGSIVPSARSASVSGLSITAPITFTLTAVRNGITKTASASIGFANHIYWGVNLTQTTDETTIKAMSTVVSNTRARSVNYNCSGGKFFHLAYPSRLGNATFQINNLTYSDMTMTVVPFTNEHGYTENYNVYYCNVIQFGASITLVVQ